MRRSSPQARVNLARRPFVNRRPIARLAALLWLLGIGLLVVNVKLYAGHWRGKAMNNERLAEVNRQLQDQRQELGVLDQELRQVNLRRQNGKTAFLNTLIAHRTFPWSALFDDLEEVLPRQVRLLSVKPSIKLAAEPETPRRRRRASAAGAAGGGDSGPTGAPARAPLRRNEVSLQLTAVAENEDALYELIDRLYESSSFHSPYLPGENRDLDAGSTSFSVSVVYLTGSEPPAEVEPAVEPEDAEGAEPPDEIVVVSPRVEAAEEGADDVTAEAPPRSEESEVATAEPERPAAGGAGTATPRAGRSAAGGLPGGSAGRPTAGRPTAGLPAAGLPAAGLPAAGLPAAGLPAAGRPAAGRPAEAPPPPGTPPRGPRRGGRDEAPSSGDSPPRAEEPRQDEPPFADPPASATPRVRSGSLLSDPFAAPAISRPGVRFLEAAA